MTDFMRDELGAPKIVNRSTFQAELDTLRVREKGDAIAAARRRLPMVEVDVPHRSWANRLCSSPPVLKITRSVLTGYENSLLY